METAKLRTSSRLGRDSTVLMFAVCCLHLLTGGCGIGSERKDPAELKAERLVREKASLTGDAEEYRAEIARLRRQIQALQNLPEDQRENPYELATIKIARITNFYDKDQDGRREKLIVYLQPIDMDGDTVKVAGTVNVQLWNLDNPDGDAMVDQWTVEPGELRKVWFDALITGYRLTFDRPEALDVLAEPLTVKVAFTDYLTGETYRELRVIDPELD